MSHALFFVNTFAASWANFLLRASWQGGLGIALIWLLCRLWPGMPPTPRCRLWRLAYAKLLLGLVCLPPLALPLLPRTSAPIQTVPTAASQENTAQIALTEAPLQSAATAPAPTFATLTTTAPMPPPPSRPSLPTVQTCLVVAWLLGILVSLVPIAAAWRRAQTFYNTSAPLADEALQAEAADLCRRFGLHRVPPLRVTDGLTSPVLLGLTRPSILLPAFVLSDSLRPELRLMLAHELAHLARRDLLWNVLPLLAQRLFFFHPLVWFAGHEWALAQEIACDALAVEVTETPPSAYGRMLLAIATRRHASAASLFPTLAVAAPRHTLRRRLFAMQHLGTVSRPRVLLAAALTAALALGGLLPWRVVAQSGPPPSISPAITQGDEDWQKQQQKELADIASKNAQLDAQLTEVQKHLPVAQPKKAEALAYIRWINADYATNQMNVQLLEQQRADYVAAYPNSLSNTQIAFVQKVNLDKLNHRRISKSTQAKLAAIPKDQRDRVAGLRYYDLHILFARMRALAEKQANVFQLRVEYSVPKQRLAGKLPVKQQSRQTTARALFAQFAHLHASTTSSRLGHRLYYFPKQGHRVRIFAQDAIGRHLTLDKLSRGWPIIVTVPVTAKERWTEFLVYDNGKLVKEQSL